MRIASVAFSSAASVATSLAMPASRSQRRPASKRGRRALRASSRDDATRHAMSASFSWIAWCCADRLAHRLAHGAVAQRRLERGVRDADAAGGDVDAPELEPALSLREAPPLDAAEQPVGVDRARPSKTSSTVSTPL